MKVAIAGAGNIAQIHAPLILAQPGNELVAIADPDKARARSMCAALGVPHAYDDVAAMLKEQKPQVVHVLTPPQQHADVAIMAMESGCHVYVEKPLALTRADADRMYAAAQKNQVKLCVNHNMVYEHSIRKALDMVKAGDLGDLVSVELNMVFDPNRSPAYITDGAEFVHWIYKMNGGPLQDQMPHPLSIALELLGDVQEIRQVSQRMGVLPTGWDDEIRVLLKGSRATGCINISLNEKPDTFKMTINGKRGRVTADPFIGAVIVQKRSCLPRAAVRGLVGFQTANQYIRCAWANIFRFAAGKVDKTNGLGEIVKAFYEALAKSGPMPVSQETAVRSVDLMEKMWPAPPAAAAAAGVDEDGVTLPAGVKPPATGPVTLVTGGAGFVGFYLVKQLLAKGARVRVLVRKNSLHAGRLKGLAVEIVEGNLSDAEAVNRAVEGCEQVYHVGAAMSNKWEDHQESTVNGTRYVVEACLKHGVKRMLHVSSLVVYETLAMPSGALVDEDTPYQEQPRRMGPYPFAKIQAERTVMDAVKNQGLKATIVRPGIVLGPLSGILYPHLGYKLGTDVFLPIGSGYNVLPLVYVENAVDGMIKAMASEKAIGKMYNLVDDGKISVNEYLERFKTVTGAKSKIIHFPYFMAWSLSFAYEVAAMLKVVKPGATSRAQLKWKQKDVYYDGARSRQDFEYKTTVPLTEAMDKTFRWWAGKFGV